MTRTLEQVLAGIKGLEPLPVVATRVLALAGREDVVPSELSALIRTDAALCTRVLKLCNSAYYGFRREIASLEEAANCLGVQRLSSLVLTSCAARWFHDCGGLDGQAFELLWRRNVAHALGAQAVARASGWRGAQDRAYTAGLLQDLGEVVIRRSFRAEHAEIEAERARGCGALDAERLVLGADHAEIGARLVERWGLPEVLVDTIRHHHAPARARCDPRLAACVRLGAELALACEDGGGAALVPGTSASANVVGASALALVELDPGRLPALVAALGRELERAQQLVEIG